MVRSSRFVHTDELITRNINFKISYRTRMTPTSYVKITRQSEEQSTSDALNVQHIWQILEIPGWRKKNKLRYYCIDINFRVRDLSLFFFFFNNDFKVTIVRTVRAS